MGVNRANRSGLCEVFHQPTSGLPFQSSTVAVRFAGLSPTGTPLQQPHISTRLGLAEIADQTVPEQSRQ